MKKKLLEIWITYQNVLKLEQEKLRDKLLYLKNVRLSMIGQVTDSIF